MFGWNQEYKIYSELYIKSMWFETKNNKKKKKFASWKRHIINNKRNKYNQESSMIFTQNHAVLLKVEHNPRNPRNT